MSLSRMVAIEDASNLTVRSCENVWKVLLSQGIVQEI